VADFEGPSGYGVSEIVIEDLRKATKQFPSVRVLSLGTNITAQQGSEFARQIGTESNAHVVIWGWYRKSSDKVFVTFHFEKLTGGHDDRIPVGERTKIVPVTDLEHFTVQRQLSTELTPIALLLGALWKIDIAAFSDATALLTAAIASSPPTDVLPSIYFYRAWSIGSEMDNQVPWNPNQSLSNCVADLTKAIQLDTNFFNAYFNRSSAYLHLNLGHEALADCEEVLRRDPRHYAALLNKGVALAQLRRFDDAFATIETAFQSAPSSREMGHCHAARANVHADVGNYQKVVEDNTRVIALVPELELGGTFNRGLAYENLKEYDKAVADFTRVAQLHPSRAYPLRQRANCYNRQGKWSLAIADYNRAIARWPQDAESYLNRGQAYRALGKVDLALSDIQHAQQLDTNSALACFQAGVCFLVKSNLVAAETNFSAAIQRDKSLSDAFAKRGIVRVMRGELPAGILDLTEALSGRPSDPKEAYLYRGQAFFVLREDAKAVADLEKVVNLNPEIDSKYMDARLNLAGQLSHQRNFKEALSHFEKIGELRPTNALALGTVFLGCLFEGDRAIRTS
jgi:tetratricopeptide (TPR) repeat protein